MYESEFKALVLGCVLGLGITALVPKVGDVFWKLSLPCPYDEPIHGFKFPPIPHFVLKFICHIAHKYQPNYLPDIGNEESIRMQYFGPIGICHVSYFYV
jgi:hypothetical protein